MKLKFPTPLLLLPAIALTALAAEAYLSITEANGQRVIRSNGLPDHKPGQFPRRGNPNTISAQKYELHMPLKPQIAAQPTSSGHAFFGVAINGVPFEPGTAEFWNRDPSAGWKYEAMSGKIDLGLDEHNAHVQPTGAYHYHGAPTGLCDKLGGDTGKKMLLIGYAADGFPIYTAFAYADANDGKSPLKIMHSSYQVRKGERPNGPGGAFDGTFTEDFEYVASSGDLDECNGRVGVTPEFPEGTFYYCVTAEFPQLSRQWKGTPDGSFMKGPPGGGRGGPRGPGGPGMRGKGPPPGGRRGGPGQGPPGFPPPP
jgi:YHYH protein